MVPLIRSAFAQRGLHPVADVKALTVLTSEQCAMCHSHATPSLPKLSGCHERHPLDTAAMCLHGSDGTDLGRDFEALVGPDTAVGEPCFLLPSTNGRVNWARSALPLAHLQRLYTTTLLLVDTLESPAKGLMCYVGEGKRLASVVYHHFTSRILRQRPETVAIHHASRSTYGIEEHQAYMDAVYVSTMWLRLAKGEVKRRMDYLAAAYHLAELKSKALINRAIYKQAASICRRRHLRIPTPQRFRPTALMQGGTDRRVKTLPPHDARMYTMRWMGSDKGCELFLPLE
jgi:hypothetical protein